MPIALAHHVVAQALKLDNDVLQYACIQTHKFAQATSTCPGPSPVSASPLLRKNLAKKMFVCMRVHCWLSVFVLGTCTLRLEFSWHVHDPLVHTSELHCASLQHSCNVPAHTCNTACPVALTPSTHMYALSNPLICSRFPTSSHLS